MKLSLYLNLSQGVPSHLNRNHLLSNPFVQCVREDEEDDLVKEAYRQFLWGASQFATGQQVNGCKTVSQIASEFGLEISDSCQIEELPDAGRILRNVADRIRHGEKIVEVFNQPDSFNYLLRQYIHKTVNSASVIKPLLLLFSDLLNIRTNNSGIIIVQQVNCRRVMGAGLAAAIAKKYPHVLLSYTKREKPWKLGDTQFVAIAPDGYVCNLAGQENYGREKVQTDIEAVRAGLASVRNFAIKDKLQIYIPFGFGSGNAGGKTSTERMETWGKVQQAIADVCPEAIIVFKPFE
jgi:hypothetical protein